ncbi:MAG: hypothetical protein AABZ06_07080, partial [Bdellovibrionota bacterium]
YDIPGKVFILGEYSVLADGAAVIATVGPRFGMRVFRRDAECSFFDAGPFHPKSPAARLVDFAIRQDHDVTDLAFGFEDFCCGKGGLGSSTAQFALVYLALAGKLGWETRWQKVWKLYRELAGSSVFVPSGADLIGQWVGGVNVVDLNQQQCFDVFPVFDWSRLLVFSATGQQGRKVATHEHLSGLANTGFLSGQSGLLRDLKNLTNEAVGAIKNNQPMRLGEVMDEYADSLSAVSLESSETKADRAALRNMSGVIGVKGCGAMQSDVLLVLMGASQDFETRKKVVDLALSRGLELVEDSLTFQMGISCQKN